MVGSELRNRMQRAAAALARQMGAARRRGTPGSMRRAAALLARMQQRARAASASISRHVGTAVRKGAAHPGKITHAAGVMVRKMGLHPGAALHPGRSWAVLLIAVAVAESAHAPLLNSSVASWKNPTPIPRPVATPPLPPGKGSGHGDMHGPAFPDPKIDPTKKKQEKPDLKELDLILPDIYHGISGDVTPPTPGIDVIHTSDNGVVYFDPGDGGGGHGGDNGWNQDVHPSDHGGRGISGGGDGGAGGDGGGGSGGAGDLGPVRDGNTTPTVSPPIAAVPEPGSLSILLGGLFLLGRRGRRSPL